jgi:hypothetical protein
MLIRLGNAMAWSFNSREHYAVEKKEPTTLGSPSQVETFCIARLAPSESEGKKKQIIRFVSSRRFRSPANLGI